MFTHVYTVALISALAGIWLGCAVSADDRERHVLSGVLLAGLLLSFWVETLLVCGLSSLSASPTILRSFACSQRGKMIALVAVMLLTMLLTSVSTEPNHYRWLLGAAVISMIVFPALLHSYALVLGASNAGTFSASQAQIRRGVPVARCAAAG
jgi:hypothetical protein